MKKLLIAVIAVLPLVALDASASSWGNKKPHRPKPPAVVSSVPEINGASAALAFGLLGGIVAIRRERKKLAEKK